MTQPRRPHSLPVFLCAALVLLLPLITTAASLRAAGQSELLVNNATLGYYNFAGNALDNTDPWFPHPVPPDPTLLNAPEPDRQALVSKAGLGALLVDNPLAGGGLGSGWGPLRTIPSSWTPTTENAIIYEIDAGPLGIKDLTGNFSVDNGIYIWVNGRYQFGAMEPGTLQPGVFEYSGIPLGDLHAGKNYLQILREDHGGGTGYLIEVSGTRVTSDPTLLVRATGPGWSIDRDPAQFSRNVFEPIPTLADMIFRPRADFEFQCPVGQPLDSCTSYLVIKAYCGGNLAVTNPSFYLFPLPQPTLRDLLGGYEELQPDEYVAYCQGTNGRTFPAAAPPIALFSLQEGGARLEAVDEAWRFTLQTPLAGIYSAGLNLFTAVHDPTGGASTISVLKGAVEVDPTAVGAGPFVLSARQRVTVTAAGPGPITELPPPPIYLPTLLR